MVIIGRGHVNIRASNRRTIEFTSDPYVSQRGDCILLCCIEVEDRGLMERLRERGVLQIHISVGNLRDSFTALTPMRRPRDASRIVFRRSTHVDEHTFGIQASKAANDIDRGIVDLLRRGYVALAEVLLTR